MKKITHNYSYAYKECIFIKKKKIRILVRKVEYLKDIHKPKNIVGVIRFGEYSQRLPSNK